MKTVTVDSVRARLSFLEGLNARGVGTAVPQQQFEIACLRELLALLVCRPMPVTVKLPTGTEVNGFQMLIEEEVIARLRESGVTPIVVRAAGIGVKGE